MQPTTIAELIARARSAARVRIVLPAAEIDSSLGAAVMAKAEGLADSTLIGSRSEVEKRIVKLQGNPADFEILDEPDDVAAARRAVALVREGHAQVILKGRLSTGDLMRAVLDKQAGLRTGRVLSDVMLSEHPLERRLLGVTDGGLNVAPDLAAKRMMIENAVKVFHRLGFERPRVACLCALEQVTESMPHTLEARALTEMAEKGEISGCDVYGPLALDNALSAKAAADKGITHPVAGCADILLMANIEAGNALGKAFKYLAGKPMGHVVEGALAPILIPSRTESSEDKLISIALGVLSAQKAG